VALYNVLGGLFMKKLITGSEMKIIDEYTISTLKIPSLVLMERAAMSVCKYIDDDNGRYLAVCGLGNNGADAMAVARILNAKGIRVDVLLCEENVDKGSEGFKYQLQQAKLFDVNIYNKVEFEKYDYIIDGIFGIGLTRDVTGKYKEVIDSINLSNCKVIAVDCPSGMDCNTGKILGTAIKADITVTFGAMKKGLLLYPGAEKSGRIYVEDIGFPNKAFEDMLEVNNYMTDEQDVYLLPKRCAYSNKGSYGKAVIIAGSKNMCGAAIMAAKACIAMGVGLVKVITCEENRVIIQSQVPEAILSTYTDDISHVESEINWGDVVLIGPGLSTGGIAAKLVEMAINSDKKLVLDADAINILSENKGLLDNLKGKQAVITPHLGEMSRLIKANIEDICNSITECCQEFALAHKIICVLKDARTVISNGENYVVNSTGNNGMAKGGSGDVLAGMIAGILVNKKDVYESAILGVYLHGLAGDKAATKKGKYSMSPIDIIDNIGEVINQVED